MTNIQDRAKRIQEILKTQDILKDTEHEQVKKVGNDLLKINKTWKDEGIVRVVADSSGFAYFLKSLAETHSTEDIKTVVEVAFNMQQPSGNGSYDEYGQVTDDLFDCLDKWKNADISRLFALETILDITAIELGQLLSEEGAKKVMLDYVINRYSGI